MHTSTNSIPERTKNLHTATPGKLLVQNFPDIPQDIEMTDIQSDITTLPILHQPAVTFEVYLPPIDSICPIKFHDDNKYALPYVKTIPKNSPIGQQLPEAALKQQWVLGIKNEEPIHAHSAHEELTRLRTSHANKKIKLILAPRVIDNNNKYKEQRSKFDQMRPILALVTSRHTNEQQITSLDQTTYQQHILINTDTRLSSPTNLRNKNNHPLSMLPTELFLQFQF